MTAACNPAGWRNKASFWRRVRMKRRKPDLLFLLALIVGLGVVVTGYTQELMERPAPTVSVSR